MDSRVKPLHYVTVEYWLRTVKEQECFNSPARQHRFLHSVETWIDGVDQQLEGLTPGQELTILLQPEIVDQVASLWDARHGLPAGSDLLLHLRVLEVVEATPREVVKALAENVQCCDHCGSH
ncbi:MAG: hypothetical protein JRJ12_07645 [Deltaproteobacteria bacterium]|nr:hypothetical protein [Deltaproteobacteria bacterium]MBW2070367.1 hypothetical protein [Deltaproteobacteria bacterium]